MANLRLTTFTFWSPGFMTLNLKIIFQNCWHNNLTNPIFCQFTVNMYHQFTDPSQLPLVDTMCEVLPTEKTWMLEQRETSKLKLLLTDNGCAHFQTSLFYWVCRFLSSIYIAVRETDNKVKSKLRISEIFFAILLTKILIEFLSAFWNRVFFLYLKQKRWKIKQLRQAFLSRK